MTFYGVVQAALERTRPRGPEADAPPSSRSSVQRDAASHASLALEKLKSAVEEKIESLQSRIAESFSGPGAFRNHSSISIRGHADTRTGRECSNPEEEMSRDFEMSESDVQQYLQDGSLEWWTNPRRQRAASSPATSPSERTDHAKLVSGKTHLIVLMNGVNGHHNNWKEFHLLATSAPEFSHCCFYTCRSSEKKSTFDGIHTCGDRIIQEIKPLVEAGRENASRGAGLTHISFIGHSMGGLICRYAIGKVYNPETGLLLGLKPAHFITLATPHLGCDGAGVSQVPLLAWAGEVPLIGSNLQKAMVGKAAMVTATIFGRSGEQLFLQDDDGTDGQPLIEALTKDDSLGNRFFMSGLKSFRTRTAYANVSGDHVVGWANSSLRFQDELPPPQVFTETSIFDDDALPSPSPPSPPPMAAPRQGLGLRVRGSSPDLTAGEVEMQKLDNTARSSPPRPRAYKPSAPSSPGRLRPSSAAAPLKPLEPRVTTYVNTRVTNMLLRLQEMSWKRVDVSFKGHIHGFLAHNHIQVTRKWLNKAGMPTVEHLLHLLADMEGVLQLEVEAEAQQRREGTSTQLDGNSQGDLGRTPRLEPLEEERVRGGRNSEEDGEAAAVSLTREPLESNEEGEGGGGQMDGGHGEGHAEEGGRKLAGDKQHEALEATPP